MSKYKIGIWGQYGDPGTRIADGQAVRTNIITNELQRRYGENQVCIANSNRWKNHPFRFLFHCIMMIAQSEKIIIMPADNGFKIFVPILMAVNVFFRHELYYVVVGGFLPELLKAKPWYIKLVKRFNALFVQTENLRKDLYDLGIESIYILSNLKRLNTRKLEDLKVNLDPQVKLCVFSRINKEKGIEDAIKAVRMANEQIGKIAIELDLYGMVPEYYKPMLHLLLEENKEFVAYRGIAEYTKTVETLQQYFALLFPTFYYGEGFPGNLIDAFHSATPIIASDWMYNNEIVQDGVHGFLVEPHNPQMLCDAIIKLYEDRELAYQFACNCLNEAPKYQPEKVLQELYTFLDRQTSVQSG